MLTIRVAENKDLAEILVVIDRVLVELGLELQPDGLDSDLSDIAGTYVAPGGLFVVVEDERGEIAGTAGLMRISETQCELRKMYFLPSIRGQGWGEALLDFLLDSAVRLGFKEVHLETNNTFHAAIGLYQKAGFEQKDRSGSCDVRCDRAYYLALEKYQRPAGLRELNIAI